MSEFKLKERDIVDRLCTGEDISCRHEFAKTVGYFGQYVCEKCGKMKNFINGISGSKYEFVK